MALYRLDGGQLSAAILLAAVPFYRNPKEPMSEASALCSCSRYSGSDLAAAQAYPAMAGHIVTRSLHAALTDLIARAPLARSWRGLGQARRRSRRVPARRAWLVPNTSRRRPLTDTRCFLYPTGTAVVNQYLYDQLAR